MDAGRLNERLTLLTLTGPGTQEETASAWEWKESGTVWGSVEETGRHNLFSRVGLGERGLRIHMRRRADTAGELSLHNALRWRGKHCFLTAIRVADRRYLEIEAALVPVTNWSVWKNRKKTGEDGFIHIEPGESTSFPAVMTEKYLSSAEETARYQTTIRYVLITPKAICLDAGEIVRQGNPNAGVCWRVALCHTLDEYKNEYEIEREADD